MDPHYQKANWLGCRHADSVKRSMVLQVADHSDELEALQRMLHFPEEVAASLTETEYRLFYNVPPIDYLRQVTLDVGAPSNAAPKSSVRTLVKRFKEVSPYSVCSFMPRKLQTLVIMGDISPR